MNTIPLGGFSFYEMLNEIVQQEPATSLGAELAGSLAAIVIIKGKPFAPDARMKKILTEAVATANVTSRILFISPRDPSWFYNPGSSWSSLLFQTGYEFETPIAEITREAPSHFRLPHAGRTNLFFLRRHRHHPRNGHASDRHWLTVSACQDRCGQELL